MFNMIILVILLATLSFAHSQALIRFSNLERDSLNPLPKAALDSANDLTASIDISVLQERLTNMINLEEDSNNNYYLFVPFHPERRIDVDLGEHYSGPTLFYVELEEDAMIFENVKAQSDLKFGGGGGGNRQ
ncbi:Uncharacterized protein Fot_12415 [Forsythia ovata]|uniref:Uncharacterized protein n=1 Tax=Forsythia ovata TaxID=205694 RepID=A0ABD1WN34_9LAMI